MSGIFSPDPSRSGEARIMFELGYIKATCNQILATVSARPQEPESAFWAWWARAQLRLGFIGTAYKAFRMVPWGLIFLALVAIWKFLLRLIA